jgi:two-component system, chemotaxis family, protein-glutamate methylesterase/glutaminase
LIPVTRHSDAWVETLIVIGTSTGGPQALTSLMQRLPAIEHAACCIVQHMPPGFTANLAKRLNQVSAWAVQEAKDGDLLEPGHVYVAPGGFQMEVTCPSGDGRLSVAQTGLVNGHQPAVDVLFHSAEKHWKRRIVGVMLTGMGKDGASGLKAIREIGGYTIAEAESSCIVYGMPKAAVNIGAAMEVVTLTDVQDAILRGCPKQN